tara:strand:- start:38 stop:1342 length:1305 start_codon:yes stop_codon:yes gene_type:complete
MKLKNDLYFKKKILIYGLGTSGISCLNFLKKDNLIKCFDDNPKYLIKKFKKYSITREKIKKTNFDHIIISPGINSLKCSLKNYLKKNKLKICTDLDVFYAKYFNNFIIAITGTNGKSTTSKLLNDILRKNKYDSRLVGNIGNAVLKEKNISNKTIFVFEISSYQISYSKIFKANYVILLNISPDHLERHKTFNNYLQTKFKLIYSLKKNDYAFINKGEKIFKRLIHNKRRNCKIFNVNDKLSKNDIALIKNSYFKSLSNQENLSFILKVCAKLKVKKKSIFKVVNAFKALNFRQEIIYQSKNLKIINDSKSTSFSSSINLLNNYNNIFWICGGLPKKGDKLKLVNRKNIKKIYLYGKYQNFFIKFFRKKYHYSKFNSLDNVMKQVSKDIISGKKNKKINLLFSPCAASFDSFKNFEERGKYFNYLVNKYKLKNV